MSKPSNVKDRCLIAIIGDEDTVTGCLLAGVGHVDARQKSNFLVVDNKTSVSLIEETFKTFLSRKDIAIILINQHIAEEIRHLLEAHHDAFPSVLEIPSKDHPYDPEKDSVLKRWTIPSPSLRILMFAIPTLEGVEVENGDDEVFGITGFGDFVTKSTEPETKTESPILECLRNYEISKKILSSGDLNIKVLSKLKWKEYEEDVFAQLSKSQKGLFINMNECQSNNNRLYFFHRENCEELKCGVQDDLFNILISLKNNERIKLILNKSSIDTNAFQSLMDVFDSKNKTDKRCDVEIELEKAKAEYERRCKEALAWYEAECKRIRNGNEYRQESIDPTSDLICGICVTFQSTISTHF
ncbi:ATPase, V1 complex, subunit F domain-containing protein [Rozella allomycis CSF55]|uniref:V-type proton ATPase subunit F n=1 Tax=Rozella allomycis (strain CSF55) TaxID=988480 RepID=A0A075APJ7_ROZAC|nr:ATPase, V1 complex, subunit F domain-containing protein [Rozella allomycis CSF55]|eukprot:EPZ31988.1 ATPase, V1 complex, subunit F domain-containing protein [Rozella allomycis CSF55]